MSTKTPGKVLRRKRELYAAKSASPVRSYRRGVSLSREEIQSETNSRVIAARERMRQSFVDRINPFDKPDAHVVKRIIGEILIKYGVFDLYGDPTVQCLVSSGIVSSGDAKEEIRCAYETLRSAKIISKKGNLIKLRDDINKGSVS